MQKIDLVIWRESGCQPFAISAEGNSFSIACFIHLPCWVRNGWAQGLQNRIQAVLTHPAPAAALWMKPFTPPSWAPSPLFTSCCQAFILFMQPRKPRCNCTQPGLVKHTDQDKPVYLVSPWWPSPEMVWGMMIWDCWKKQKSLRPSCLWGSPHQSGLGRSTASLQPELPKRSLNGDPLWSPAAQHGDDTGGLWPRGCARCGLECHHLAEQGTESCTSGTGGSCAGCNYSIWHTGHCAGCWAAGAAWAWTNFGVIHGVNDAHSLQRRKKPFVLSSLFQDGFGLHLSNIIILSPVCINFCKLLPAVRVCTKVLCCIF